jgi:hypothetical protein
MPARLCSWRLTCGVEARRSTGRGSGWGRPVAGPSVAASGRSCRPASGGGQGWRARVMPSVDHQTTSDHTGVAVVALVEAVKCTRFRGSHPLGRVGLHWTASTGCADWRARSGGGGPEGVVASGAGCQVLRAAVSCVSSRAATLDLVVRATVRALAPSARARSGWPAAAHAFARRAR